MSAYRLKADFKIGFRAVTNVCSAFALRRYLGMPTAKELAVEAVIGEPVSAFYSLLRGKIQANFGV